MLNGYIAGKQKEDQKTMDRRRQRQGKYCDPRLDQWWKW